MNGEIKIGIGDAQETAQEFVEAWSRAERGEVPERPMERLYFPDLEMLLRTPVPRCIALLKRLHAIGPVSVRALSRELGRNYKDVHTDIRVLERIGLEDYLPIEAVSAEASREKSVRFGTCGPEPLRIRNPVKHLDQLKREVVTARQFDIPAVAIEEAARERAED